MDRFNLIGELYWGKVEEASWEVKNWAEYRKLISNSRRNKVLKNTFKIYRLVTNLTAYPSKIIQTNRSFLTTAVLKGIIEPNHFKFNITIMISFRRF